MNTKTQINTNRYTRKGTKAKPRSQKEQKSDDFKQANKKFLELQKKLQGSWTNIYKKSGANLVEYEGITHQLVKLVVEKRGIKAHQLRAFYQMCLDIKVSQNSGILPEEEVARAKFDLAKIQARINYKIKFSGEFFPKIFAIALAGEKFGEKASEFQGNFEIFQDFFENFVAYHHYESKQKTRFREKEKQKKTKNKVN